VADLGLRANTREFLTYQLPYFQNSVWRIFVLIANGS